MNFKTSSHGLITRGSSKGKNTPGAPVSRLAQGAPGYLAPRRSLSLRAVVCRAPPKPQSFAPFGYCIDHGRRHGLPGRDHCNTIIQAGSERLRCRQTLTKYPRGH